jgi:hypothetical protein
VNSVDECYQRAVQNGYKNFGLQYYSQCFAGNNENWDRHGKVTNEAICETMGTAWNNLVYTVINQNETRKPNFTWEPNYTKESIFVIGPLLSNPWVSNQEWAAHIRTLPNWQALASSSIRWIWYTPNSAIYAPIITRGIYKIYTNSTNRNIEARFHWVVDNTMEFIGLNDTPIQRYSTNNTGSVSFTFLPGDNRIQFNCRNQGGPGGFVGVCMEGSSILFYTDDSWKWMNNIRDPRP